MNNVFQTVAVEKPKHSTFDLSHEHKSSMSMGRLVPAYVQECLPGDRFSLAVEAMFRLMPMVSPAMHKCDVTFHHFFVPNRLLWDNWEKFITAGESFVSGALPPALPVINLNNGGPHAGLIQPSDLANYLGLPVFNATPFLEGVSALPFAAYQLIWHEYYRDENLQPEATFPRPELVDGVQGTALTTRLTTLRNRAWQHDYFTSALPYAQKGDPVMLPLDFADAPVSWKIGSGQPDTFVDPISGLPMVGFGSPAYALAGLAGGNVQIAGPSGGGQASVNPDDHLFVDGTDLNSYTTINDLRTSWALQQWLEKNMRAGSRYRESLLAHFGVRSSDQRLDRPEYFGGTKGTVRISEVLQTSSTDLTSPQATMAGHGLSVIGSDVSRYRCEEHGFIVSMLSIMPTTAYYQGLPRFFTKAGLMDYAFPNFAQLGEQEILNKEIFYGQDGHDNETFGYIPRYAEYRYNPSRVSGQMATTLEHWHMARKFASRPALNAAFVVSDPTTRIYADTNPADDSIVFQAFIKVLAARALPVFGVPAPLV